MRNIGVRYHHDRIAHQPQPHRDLAVLVSPDPEAFVKASAIRVEIPAHRHEAPAQERDLVGLRVGSREPLLCQPRPSERTAPPLGPRVLQRADRWRRDTHVGPGRGTAHRLVPVPSGLDVGIAEHDDVARRVLGAEVPCRRDAAASLRPDHLDSAVALAEERRAAVRRAVVDDDELGLGRRGIAQAIDARPKVVAFVMADDDDAGV
jgi:hypothetical protein